MPQNYIPGAETISEFNYLYNLGYKVIAKIEKIIREEMNSIGSVEILMPSVQPAELWQESERWDQYGPELLRFSDRHDRNFCFGPTYEEVITDLIRKDVSSYKQLPINFFQISSQQLQLVIEMYIKFVF